MSSEAALTSVVAFDKLPSTPEKEEIKRQYLADEIGSYEFFCLADRYLEKTNSGEDNA
jgi:hypothetical protein